MTLAEDFQTEGLLLLNKIKSQLTVHTLVRYLVEGYALAIAAYVIPNKKTQFNEITAIALIAALTLFVLDLLSDDVAKGVRLGSGFGIGINLVNPAIKMSLPFI